MRRANFAMAPDTLARVTENKINNNGLRYHMRFNYKYTARRKPFLQGALTVAELQRHWRPVGVFGSYTLYQKVD